MTIDPTQGTPDVAPPLNPELMQAIRVSASRLMLLEGTFISQLYDDVMTLIPGLAADGRAFCERMVRSVLWAAIADQPPKVIADTLRWAGATNWMEGFPESEYASVAHALVRTVRGLSGDDWSASMGSAWITYFLWIQPYLVDGARLAAAQQQASAQRPVQRPERWRASPQDPYAMPVQVPHGDVGLDSMPPGMPAPGMPADAITPRLEKLSAPAPATLPPRRGDHGGSGVVRLIVVGSGIVGASCAYAAVSLGADVMLVDPLRPPARPA